jgi:hypothetical protein
MTFVSIRRLMKIFKTSVRFYKIITFVRVNDGSQTSAKNLHERNRNRLWKRLRNLFCMFVDESCTEYLHSNNILFAIIFCVWYIEGNINSNPNQ